MSSEEIRKIINLLESVEDEATMDDRRPERGRPSKQAEKELRRDFYRFMRDDVEEDGEGYYEIGSACDCIQDWIWENGMPSSNTMNWIFGNDSGTKFKPHQLNYYTSDLNEIYDAFIGSIEEFDLKRWKETGELNTFPKNFIEKIKKYDDFSFDHTKYFH